MTETQARDEICRVGKSLFDRGYVHATAGNISVRLDDGGFLITPTDACLGFLEPTQLARLDADARQTSGPVASKTIALHAAIYRAASTFDAQTRCVIHTHSTHCVALTLQPAGAEPDAPGKPIYAVEHATLAELQKRMHQAGSELTESKLTRELGQALVKDDLDKAKACYNRLNEFFKDTEYADGAAVGLAEIAYEQGEFDKALELFRKAMVDYAGSSRLLDATRGEAKALYKLKKFDEAKKIYENILNTKEWRGEAHADDFSPAGLQGLRRGTRFLEEGAQGLGEGDTHGAGGAIDRDGMGLGQPGFGFAVLLQFVPVDGHASSCQHLRFVGMAGDR